METAAIEALAARQEIVDVITELFVATDQRDWGAVKRCFADQVLEDRLRPEHATFRFDLKFIDGNANLESDG